MWYDPDVQLTSTGDLNLIDQSAIIDTNFTVPHYFTLNDALGNPIQKVGAFAEIAVADLKVGFIDAQQISTKALSVTTENFTIKGQSLRDYITGIVTQIINSTNNNVTSPLPSVDTLNTNLISPLAQNPDIGLKLEDNKLSIVNGNTSSASAVASFDNLGNATFSGSLTANGASIAGTLRAGKIIADQIEGLNLASSSATYVTNNVTNIYNSTASAFPTLAANPSEYSTGSGLFNGLLASGNYIDVSSYSGQFANVGNLNAITGTFGQGLMVFGPSSLSDTSVVGQLSVNGSLILADNSINVLGSNLSLQPLRQGGLSIMGGLIYIDSNGNARFGANADFAGDVNVHGTLSSNILSPDPRE